MISHQWNPLANEREIDNWRWENVYSTLIVFVADAIFGSCTDNKEKEQQQQEKKNNKTIEMMKADWRVLVEEAAIGDSTAVFGGRVLNKSIYLDSIYVTHGKQLS